MKDTEMRVMGKTLRLKGIGHITPFVTCCALIKYLLVEHRQLIKTFQYKATCDEKLNRIFFFFFFLIWFSIYSESTVM